MKGISVFNQSKTAWIINHSLLSLLPIQEIQPNLCDFFLLKIIAFYSYKGLVEELSTVFFYYKGLFIHSFIVFKIKSLQNLPCIPRTNQMRYFVIVFLSIIALVNLEHQKCNLWQIEFYFDQNNHYNSFNAMTYVMSLKCENISAILVLLNVLR